MSMTSFAIPSIELSTDLRDAIIEVFEQHGYSDISASVKAWLNTPAMHDDKETIHVEARISHMEDLS
jgi:hypothetical protein